MDQEELISLTADIVATHVANNTVPVGDVANLLQQVYGTLAGLGAPVEEVAQEKIPVVSVRASVKPDYIVCMECGKRQKALKRHLQSAHGMTPDQYRKDYGLPREYPMVSPNYSQTRRDMAHSIGLGRKRKDAPAIEDAAEDSSTKVAKKARKGASAKRSR